MSGSKNIMRALAGLGLAGALFMGCQDLLNNGKDSSNPSVTPGTAAPADLALRLTVKDSGACRDLEAQIEAAKAGGRIDTAEIATFAGACIKEIVPGDTGKHVELPPVVLPDSQLRCRWIRTQIDGGREDLVIKFHYYCPDDCDGKDSADTAEHAKLCREPRPEEKPSCDTLKTTLKDMDSNSEEGSRLKRFVGDMCREPKPVPDTNPEPKPLPGPNCDSLRLMLSQADSGSETYAMLLHMMMEKKCVLPHHDSLPPEPKPVPDSMLPPPKPVPGPNCDSLRLMLSQADSGSETYSMLLHMMMEKKCVMPHPDTLPPAPKPVPGPSCDSLRLMLSQADSGSETYSMLLHAMVEKKCVLPHPDTLPPAPKPPVVNCDELRIKLGAVTDTTGELYRQLSGTYREHCPVDTLP